MGSISYTRRLNSCSNERLDLTCPTLTPTPPPKKQNKKNYKTKKNQKKNKNRYTSKLTIFRLDSVIGSNLVNLQQHVYSNRPFLNSLPNKVPIRFLKYFLLQFSSCDKSSMAFNYPMFLKKSLPHH